MRDFLKGLSLLLILSLSAACATRDTLGHADQAPAGAITHRIMVATTREYVGGTMRFSGARGHKMQFSGLRVSVPPNHRTGKIEWPAGPDADPRHNFATLDQETLSRPEFKARINRELAGRAAPDREIFLFVHGFNTTFAEGLYRQVQMHHDFGVTAVPVQFAWPSRARTLEYVYDRDSVAISRAPLAALMRTLTETNARNITLVAHSMGGLLTMETLQHLAVTGQRSVLDRLNTVILISPDVDVDVFKSQANLIGKLPQPFIIITSQRDLALKASALLTGQPERLGSVENLHELEEYAVIVADISRLKGGDGLHHKTAMTSPSAIRLLKELPDFVQSDGMQERSAFDWFQGTVSVAEHATALVFDR